MKARLFKTLVFSFLTFCLSLGFAQGGSLQIIETLRQDPKIIESELVLEDFKEGRRTTRVIVNLSKPPGFQQNGDFKNMGFRQTLQDSVKAAQDRVISRLAASKVRITNNQKCQQII